MNICLYGASSPEIDPVYLDAAYAFGRLLAQHGHTLVYGGGAQGAVRTIHNEITRSFLEKDGAMRARAGGRTGLIRRLRGRW